MASTVTRSQSNRAPLWCGGTRDSHHGRTADKSAATAWCYHVNMNQNLWGMFPTPCWIYDMNNYSSSEGKSVQPGTSNVYLIKWPVCVYLGLVIIIIIYFLKEINTFLQQEHIKSKLIVMLKIFIFQMLFMKESLKTFIITAWRHIIFLLCKNIKQHICLHIDSNKKCFLSSKSAY